MLCLACPAPIAAPTFKGTAALRSGWCFTDTQSSNIEPQRPQGVTPRRSTGRPNPGLALINPSNRSPYLAFTFAQYANIMQSGVYFQMHQHKVSELGQSLYDTRRITTGNLLIERNLGKSFENQTTKLRAANYFQGSKCRPLPSIRHGKSTETLWRQTLMSPTSEDALPRYRSPELHDSTRPPVELGTPSSSRLAARLAYVTTTNAPSDRWASTASTPLHSWIQRAARLEETLVPSAISFASSNLNIMSGRQTGAQSSIEVAA